MYVLDVCDNMGPIIQFLKNGVIPIIQIGIPILLIIFGMIDLGKAVMAGKEDEIKNAQKLLIKRAISAVAVFFVTTIVVLLFGLFADSGSDITGAGGGGFLDCWDQY